MEGPDSDAYTTGLGLFESHIYSLDKQRNIDLIVLQECLGVAKVLGEVLVDL